MDGKVMDDKDIAISVLLGQRNNLMNQIVELEVKIHKMLPFMPKDKDDDLSE